MRRWIDASGGAMLLALAACGGTPDKTAGREDRISSAEVTPTRATATLGDAADDPTAGASPMPLPIPATPVSAQHAAESPLSCAGEIGRTRADRLAAICRNVSPATRPPCNAANSCAMIEDEIARSCALFDGQGEPMAGCTPSPKSAEAAADVVRRYYGAVNARDYGTAWQQWGNDGPPNQTRTRFEAGFARTRSTRVTIGRLAPGDGGAGSIYQPVPVTVEAVLDDGTRQRFRGTYVVRRVNGVDGATADQLRWHIDSAKLTPVR